MVEAGARATATATVSLASSPPALALASTPDLASTFISFLPF